MRKEVIVWGALVLSIVLFGVGLIPFFPKELGLCGDYHACFSFGEVGFFYYIRFFIIPTPLIFTFCLFYLLKLKSPEIFRTWAKFGKVWIPVVAVTALLTLLPKQSGGFGVNFDGTALLFGFSIWVFVAVSIMIVVVKWVKLRQNNKNGDDLSRLK